jgi:HlyD family secretion protein
MTANVSIIIAHNDNVLQLKNAALRFRPPEATAEARPGSAPSGGGPPRSGGGGQRPASGSTAGRPAGARQRPPERTVYVLAYGRPKPVQIKTGISDGIVTEVTDGLKEGDTVVTAELTSASSSNSPSTNPFSGGRRFP